MFHCIVCHKMHDNVRNKFHYCIGYVLTIPDITTKYADSIKNRVNRSEIGRFAY